MVVMITAQQMQDTMSFAQAISIFTYQKKRLKFAPAEEELHWKDHLKATLSTLWEAFPKEMEQRKVRLDNEAKIRQGYKRK